MPRRVSLDDTSADAREAVGQAYGQMSDAAKLEQVRAITLAANRLALAGLRERHPEESERTLLLRLARLRLGDELTRRAYPSVPRDP